MLKIKRRKVPFRSVNSNVIHFSDIYHPSSNEGHNIKLYNKKSNLVLYLSINNQIKQGRINGILIKKFEVGRLTGQTVIPDKLQKVKIMKLVRNPKTKKIIKRKVEVSRHFFTPGKRFSIKLRINSNTIELFVNGNKIQLIYYLFPIRDIYAVSNIPRGK